MRAEPLHNRKARGAFFTPEAVAAFMAAWALRSPDDSVLEPACGEAAFLLAAANRLRVLGGKLDSTSQLVGIELDEGSAAMARASLDKAGAAHQIMTGDFFSADVPGRFDVVLGNPPFIRYQDFAGSQRLRSRKAALSLGVNLSGLASSWAAFVIAACANLAPGGRLALVLPAELLSVNYAQPVRRFLLDRFGAVRIVTFEKLIFPDAMEEVVLVLAEGHGSTDHFEIYQAHDVEDLTKLDSDQWATVPASRRGKWITGFLSAEGLAAYEAAVSSDAFGCLNDWGRPYLGSVTGNNKWFALSDEDAISLGLQRSDLIRISPPGSRHLRGLTFTDRAWQALRAEGKRVWLFRPGSDPSEAAQSRIVTGEHESVDQAYKCRVRTPWWRVPLVETPDLFLTYMNHVAPQLVTNRAQVAILNSVHGVNLHDPNRGLGLDLLPMAMLNSVTLLGAELVGRSYGGGMLKLEPKEAAALPLPTVELVGDRAAELRALRPQLARHLRRSDLALAAQLVDRVLFRGNGTPDSLQRSAIRQSRADMFARRQRRGASAP